MRGINSAPIYEANDIPLAGFNGSSSDESDLNIASIGMDEALHGGMDEESTPPAPIIEPVQPAIEAPEASPAVVAEPAVAEGSISTVESASIPNNENVLKKVQFMVVSALGAHGKKIVSRNATGQEVTHVTTSKEVFEIEQRGFAERRLAESKDKWDPKSIEGLSGWQRFGKKIERFFDRTWRTMGAEDAHRAKEKALGAELSEVAGIDSAITEEFNALIDKEARKRISAERNTKGKKFWGGVKDAWAEFRGARRDLHAHELDITRELRQKYDSDPSNSDPTENPLYALVNRDVAAREALAARINESDLDIIKQTNIGDKKTVEAIELKGEEGKKVEQFLKKEIIGKAIDDFVTRKEAGVDVVGINPKLRRELDVTLQDYFMTDEFRNWVKTLPAEQQAMFEDSFTYASDMLLQTEEVILPDVLNRLDHYKTEARLDFEMELSLGTAQLSANTEEVKDGWFTQERASLNKSLMNRLRVDRNSVPRSRIYSSGVIQENLSYDRKMGYVKMIAKNEAVVAWLSAFAGKGALTLAKSSVAWIPGLGSAGVTGAVSAFKEWGRMGQNRATFGFNKADGLEFPVAQNAIKSAELAGADYHRIQLGDRTQQFVEVQNKLKTGTVDANTAFMAMVYAADSQARLKLNNERNINLLTASKDGPAGRGIFARELRAHDLARSAVLARLSELVTPGSALENELGNMVGIKIGEVRDIKSMILNIQNAQYDNLLSGTTIDGALKAHITAVDSKLVVEQSESIRARDKIFNGMRIKSAATKGLVSGTIAGVIGMGLGKYFNHEQEIVASGVEQKSVTIIDSTLPLHSNGFSHAQIMDPSGSGVSAVMVSHVPEGTQLVQDSINPNAYDLVTTGPEAYDTLVQNITFSADGTIQMTKDLAEQISHHHLNIDYTTQTPVDWGTEAVTNTTSLTQGGIDLKVGDLEGYNEQGWWGWYNHTLSADGKAPREPEINAVLKTFRGFELWEKDSANVSIVEEAGIPHRVVHYKDLNDELFGDKQDVVSAPQGSNAVFKGIPPLWATPEGHETIVKVYDEAEISAKAGQEFASEAHRIIYEAGRGGEEGVPNAAEMKTLLDYFNNMSSGETTTGTITPHDLWITATESTVKTVSQPADAIYTTVPDAWASLAGFSYSRPLEQPVEGPLKNNKEADASPYGPYGRRSRVEEEYKSYYPGKEPDWGLYHSRRSPRLNANPNAKLDLKQESDWYFGKIESSYKTRIQSLASQTEPMSDKVRAVVCMPVAAHQEESNIYNTLTRYTNQVDKNGVKLDPATFEIFIYLNHPNNKIPDGTEREIQRFMQDFPDMPIRMIKETLKPEEVLWGKIVGAMNDTILWRSNQRTSPIKADYVMLTNDADMTAIAPTYIDNFVQELDKPENAHVDGLLGKLEWSTEAYDKYPVFHAATRFWQYVDNITRHGTVEGDGIKRPNIGSPGATFGIRASTYAGIGGYLQETGAGADQELSWMIKAARGADNSRDLYEDNYPIKMLNSAWLESSPRRGLDYYLQGKPIVNQWADWDQRAKNSDPAREKKFVDILGAGESLSNFSIERLESEINALLRLYGYDADTPVVKRALGLLGASFIKDVNGKVKLTNIDTLLKGLKDFKDNNRSQIKKSHNQAPPTN